MIAFAVARSAAAQEAPAAASLPKAEEVSLQGYAAKSPQCLEWSDGCAVCARDATAGVTHCSTPGIACQPEAIVCRKE
jgi:hypothetical protein